jgi:PAS domain-containing protein
MLPTTSTILGTIVLDIHGAIRRCSDAIAESAEWMPGDVVGRPVKALMPALPLHPGTAGYNIAYASFHSHSRRWLPTRILARDGSSVAVRARLRLVKSGSEFEFLLQLRRIDEECANDSAGGRAAPANL